ncbi:MAG: aldo/keto reductase [Planctomycetota bacterium]|jgi:predicted aldo/keto reductase-like oxidoreductase
MRKRACGKTGLDLTVIGFGAMRLHGKDIERSAAVVREAAGGGFNYFETSERYCNSTSETKVGLGLKGLRQSVYVSTKSAARDFPTAGEVRSSIDESLRRLQVEYVDFYHLWDCKLAEFEEIASKKGGTLEGIRAAMSEGLIRHLGITTHDTPERMLELLRTGEFELVTVQYNLMNRTAEPVMAEAAARGMGVIAMGPLHGGILASLSPFFERVIAEGAGATPAEIAMRFVLSNSSVTCAISGMTSASDVRNNKEIAERMRPLNAEEAAIVEEFSRAFDAAAGKVCTLCEYCMPCPKDIWIPGVMTLLTAARLLGLVGEARRQYADYLKGWAEGGSTGAPCTECGACVERCPQGIDVPAELKTAHNLFA